MIKVILFDCDGLIIKHGKYFSQRLKEQKNIDVDAEGERAFFKNELLVELPVEARLLFIGLWTLADREGRLENRPKRIKMEIYTADNFNIIELLELLRKSEFIHIYGDYIQIVNFTKHQSPHVKETASTIPAPDKHRTNISPAALNPEPPILNPESRNPLPDEGLKKGFSNGVEYNIDIYLNDTGRAFAKMNAPGWDMYGLIEIYNEGIRSGERAPPNNPNTAFPAWCTKYTKGKQL